MAEKSKRMGRKKRECGAKKGWAPGPHSSYQTYNRKLWQDFEPRSDLFHALKIASNIRRTDGKRSRVEGEAIGAIYKLRVLFSALYFFSSQDKARYVSFRGIIIRSTRVTFFQIFIENTLILTGK